jgi:iron complex outermembrane receptor protein
MAMWCITILLAAAAGIHAQEAGTIAGHVTGTGDAAVAGARIRVQRASGGFARDLYANDRGDFDLAVVPGDYLVQVDRAGFRRHVELVTVGPGSRVAVAIRLQEGGVNESITVTGSTLPQLSRETSKALTVVDRHEIDQRDAASLPEAVRFTPGVQIRENGGPGQLAQLRIRGLRPDAAAVLVDGFRLRDPASPQGDVSAFLSNLTMIDADRVEVLRGAGSSLYGTNAVGGVVNIVSGEGGGPLGGSFQLEGGSLGQSRARAVVRGGAFDDRVTFSAGALQWTVARGIDGHDASRSTGGQGLVRVKLNDATRLVARVLTSADRVDANASPSTSGIPDANIPDQTIVDAIPVPPAEVVHSEAGLPVSVGDATYFPGQDDPDSQRHSNFQTTAVELQRIESPGVSWRASYQHARLARTYDNGPDGAGFQPLTESNSRFLGTIDTAELRITVTPRSWITAIGGYELEREFFRDHEDDHAPGLARLLTETRVAQNAHALFGGADMAWRDRRVQVSVSGRLQAFRLSRPMFDAAGAISPYDGVVLANPPRAVTGDASVAYVLPAAGTKLRAHLGNAYRAPSLYERFGGGFFNDPSTGIAVFSAYGDPRLEPDRYRSIDAGVDQYAWHNRAVLSATVFYTDVVALTAFDFSGAISPETDPYGRFGGYVNGRGGFSRGVELGAELTPARGAQLHASYTYTRAETADDITIPHFFLVPGVYPHTASVVYLQQWTPRLDSSLTLQYASSSYVAFFAGGQTRAFRFPSITTTGAVVRYRLSGSGSRALRAYVKLANALDRTYYENGWRAAGRTVVAGISVGQ